MAAPMSKKEGHADKRSGGERHTKLPEGASFTSFLTSNTSRHNMRAGVTKGRHCQDKGEL
jgi:hypothetical protein